MSVYVFIYLHPRVQTYILYIFKENYIDKLKLMKRKICGFYFSIPFSLQKKKKNLSINLIILNEIASQCKVF